MTTGTETGKTKSYYQVIEDVTFTVERISKNPRDFQDDWKAKSRKYLVTITRNNKTYKTPFYQGEALTKAPKLLDLLYDMQCNDTRYYKDAQEFADNFGYGNLDELRYDDKNEYNRVWDIYEACKKETEAYYDMFTEEERDVIREHLERRGY